MFCTRSLASSAGRHASRYRHPRPYGLCVLTAVLSLGATGCASNPAQAQAPTPAPADAESGAADSRPFTFYHEFLGSRAYADPQVTAALRLGMMNGLGFSPPFEPGMLNLTTGYRVSLMLRLATGGATPVVSDDAIGRQRADVNAVAAATPGLDFVWNPMPEWDQSGGAWVAAGRPQYRGLSKSEAYGRFVHYYQSSYPSLMSYLRQPAAERKYRLAAVTDYSPNVFYACELGVDLCLLERGIDELGDLSTGVAYLRGAASQYGRSWGIDLSSWRTSNEMATTYDYPAVLRGGWSASYLMRHYYAAFMSGARVIHNEAATYWYRDGRLNPFGEATQEFADFALRRHSNVGTPVVSTALLIDHFAGFDPRYGVYNQNTAVWYRDIPYSDGDYMLDNFFRLAYPNHWLHGLAPDAPFANSAGVPDRARFQAFLAGGGDPRPYEPMPFTRWGDSIDVITNAVGAGALRQYKAIVLGGDVTLDSRLRAALQTWVEQGGVLLMNAAQARPEDESLLGVTVQTTPSKQAANSQWLSNGIRQTEAPYNYALLRPVTAEVLAVNESKDPLITRRVFGKGEVLLTAPAYLQSTRRDQLLRIGTQLLDSVLARNAPARIWGPPVEYIVNEGPGKRVITLINNAGTEWNGLVTMPRPLGSAVVLEYITDLRTPFSVKRDELTIPARVPAYGVRIFAVESDAAPALLSPVREPVVRSRTK